MDTATGVGLGTLIVMAFWIGAILFVVLLVVPQMAASRLVTELSKIRSVIGEMSADEPAVADHPDVQRLDYLLAHTISWGRPPGLSMMLAAAVTVNSGVRRHDPAFTAPQYRGLASSQRVALYLLTSRASMEVMRATFFSSRLWFLAWPLWLGIQAGVRRGETLQRDSADGSEFNRVVAVGTGLLEDRHLQVA